MDQARVMNEHVSQKAVDTTLPEAVLELCRSCSSITNIFSIWDRDLLSATKWIETHRPRLGFSYVLLTSKVGNIAFPPPSSPNTQIWTTGTGEECGFFCSLKLPYLSKMCQQFCCRLSGSQKWRYILKKTIQLPYRKLTLHEIKVLEINAT